MTQTTASQVGLLLIVSLLSGCGHSSEGPKGNALSQVDSDNLGTKAKHEEGERQLHTEDQVKGREQSPLHKEARQTEERLVERQNPGLVEEHGSERRQSQRRRKEPRPTDSQDPVVRAKLCEQLFGKLQIKLLVTPSSSTKRLVGDEYSFELRSPGMNLVNLKTAISEKRWFDALEIMAGRPISESVSDNELKGIYYKFLGKKFSALVKTKADLSRTHALSLSEYVQLNAGVFANPPRLYVDGKPIADGNLNSIPPTSESAWTRHPDGIGWFTSWSIVDGELIIAPGAYRQPRGPGIDPDANTWREVQKTISEAGLPLSTPNATGTVDQLRQRITLAELTNDEALAALDKICLERHRLKRKAALAQ